MWVQHSVTQEWALTRLSGYEGVHVHMHVCIRTMYLGMNILSDRKEICLLVHLPQMLTLCHCALLHLWTLNYGGNYAIYKWVLHLYSFCTKIIITMQTGLHNADLKLYSCPKFWGRKVAHVIQTMNQHSLNSTMFHIVYVDLTKGEETILI